MRLLFKILLGLGAWFAAGEAYHIYMKRVLIERIKRENPPDAKILNAGCGKGSLGQTTFAGTTRCDINPIPELGIEYCDVRNLPYADHSFDGIILSHVLEHLPPEDVPKALSEARRVVKDPSKIYIELPNPIFLQTWLHPGHKSLILFNNVYRNPANLSPAHVANFIVGSYALRAFVRWAAKLP